MVLYHSTLPNNIDLILKYGLIASKSKDGFIYFGEDEYTSAAFQLINNISTFSIIGFDIPEDEFNIEASYDHNIEFFKKKFPLIKNCYLTSEDIPSDFIFLVSNYKNGIITRNEIY